MARITSSQIQLAIKEKFGFTVELDKAPVSEGGYWYWCGNSWCGYAQETSTHINKLSTLSLDDWCSEFETWVKLVMEEAGFDGTIEEFDSYSKTYFHS